MERQVVLYADDKDQNASRFSAAPSASATSRMHHIIYASRASQEPSGIDLVMLLLRSRRNNESLAITGALVYGGGQFMQVIEGEKEAVTALYACICSDPRHQDVCKLVDKPIEERTFINWSMAFQKTSPEQVAELEGYVSPEYWAQTSFTGESADTLLLKRLQEIVLQGFNSQPRNQSA
jgi:hypothetical protein